MPERIQKIISAHGAASRREAEKMIHAGRVTVNGIEAQIGQSAEPGRDEIAIDGIPLAPKGGAVYIMLNKPRGFITTTRDERGRKTVAQLVPVDGIYPVGRLDMDSEGLLLMTNDGAFANAVMHPSFNKTKTYEVHVTGEIGSAVETLAMPMEIDSRTVCAAEVREVSRTVSGGVFRITVREGRNRQIRRMCAQCGLTVLSLRRIAIGSVLLGTLEIGKWRHLTDEEVSALYSRKKPG